MHKKRNKDDCGFVRLRLFAYAEDALSPGEKETFEEHCRSCEECSRIVSGFRSFETLMAEKRTAMPGPFVQTRTLQKLENFLENGKRPPLLVSRRILRPAMTAFIIIFALLIGFSIGKKADNRFTDANLSSRQLDIQSMQSDLFITDFMDESAALLENK